MNPQKTKYMGDRKVRKVIKESIEGK